MNTTIPKMPTLVNSPAETSWCNDCEVNGVHFEESDAGRYFPHCPNCGNTELHDQRSPYEVLYAARELVDTAPDAELRMYRLDDLDRIKAIASKFRDEEGQHCGDCATWHSKCIVAGLL